MLCRYIEVFRATEQEVNGTDPHGYVQSWKKGPNDGFGGRGGRFGGGGPYNRGMGAGKEIRDRK